MFKTVILLFILTQNIFCETGYEAWLRYHPVPKESRGLYSLVPETVVTPVISEVIDSSVSELSRGLKGLLGLTVKHQKSITNDNCLIVATINDIKQLIPEKEIPNDIKHDGYHIGAIEMVNKTQIIITGLTDAGVLYGTFAFLRKIALYQPIDKLNQTFNPYSPLRYANEWDNLDGSIERGYAGKSIYFANNNIVSDLTRTEDYARLLASIGINGCAVNNVNANIRVITSEFLPQIQRLAKVFSRWAIKILLSVDFASPQTVGKLNTYDPLNEKVIHFWNNKTDEIYKYVPNLAGYLIKAGVEGRSGPSKYHRTQSEAANTLARALKPHNGILFYRAFVYDHPLDWTNMTVDRAKYAYNIFHPLDGQFDDNVVVQIKFGPIDFQIREGISPLFGALRATNVALELQITQEYTGEQRHVVFWPYLWKWVLDFDLRVDNKTSQLKTIVSGKQFNKSLGGIVGVVNVGLDSNWMSNDLSMANIYGFGRLGWDPDLSLEQIVDEWTRMTFGHNSKVVDTIKDIQLHSHQAFENYTGPLGVGTLTDIGDIGSHYGPNVMSTENNGWGQWHRADKYGIGMDRSVAGLQKKIGTGFIGQYNYELMKLYETMDTCPDNLLLFMHHANYTHVLHSGKTLIQHIYDSHYSGSETARQFHKSWKQLNGLIDQQRYQLLDRKLHYQWSHSEVWRDSICQFFSKISSIPDKYNRIGHTLGRIEAENMTLVGYAPHANKPWESASGGLAVCCHPNEKCNAKTTFNENTGVYDINVQYFDENDGISDYKLFVGTKLITEWKANDTLPADRPSGDTNTRITALDIHLVKGDSITVEGVPDKGEMACLDYIQIEKS